MNFELFLFSFRFSLSANVSPNYGNQIDANEELISVELFVFFFN